ncbi:hypothetical protein NTG1052_570006 [Candidatus Nitrotoga sp. 1052]|nr:hypothetical protein NTG1052_570006 [Candidatus Nitrotoga sp. 1052]
MAFPSASVLFSMWPVFAPVNLPAPYGIRLAIEVLLIGSVHPQSVMLGFILLSLTGYLLKERKREQPVH